LTNEDDLDSSISLDANLPDESDDCNVPPDDDNYRSSDDGNFNFADDVPPTVVVVDEVGELQLDRNADSMEKDKTPSKRSVNESRALMPGKNKRVKQTIAEYSEKKSPSVDTKKGKNDITSELGESIKSIILVSGKQRNEEMKKQFVTTVLWKALKKREKRQHQPSGLKKGRIQLSQSIV